MVTNCRRTGNSCRTLYILTSPSWLSLFGWLTPSDPQRDVLFNTILRSQRCAAHVPSVTLALKFVNNLTYMRGRQNIFLDWWKQPEGCENHLSLNSILRMWLSKVIVIICCWCKLRILNFEIWLRLTDSAVYRMRGKEIKPQTLASLGICMHCNVSSDS